MSQLFHIILYQPLFNLLVFLYNNTGQDVGIAIFFLTVIIKLVLYPFTKKTLESQKAMQALQPKIKEIQEKHSHDKAAQAQETMKLYKDYGVHPLGGCLPVLIQLPLLIALFQVFRTGFDAEALTNLYLFIKNPGELNPWLLGIIDLSKKNASLAFLAGVSQFFHTYLISGGNMFQKTASEDMGKAMQKQMVFMAPVITFIVSLSLPAALPFYWLINTLLSIGEHYLPYGRNSKSQAPLTSEASVLRRQNYK
ncbi:MAG: membrane protein insertase YidC [Candidatus Colwellbacteria bacterium]|nr:membrane protein insertase YidC [Candidatus Colwellbacteria bacterium]